MSSLPDSPFAARGAPLPLARALTERGYETPTPVQEAVLATAGSRDLLVSAQTGSGKTVAFGLLLGRQLLGDAERVTPASAPRALVVAPTRELAAQVQRELDWLLAETGARVVACTGGTDVRGDARALARGVDVVVGTPGRLVDLLTRQKLDLTGLELVVLDEADEMLDLGFREALTTLLEAAPPSRRTLLFSATLPPAITALAKRYQKEALAIDPRAGTTAHEDIQHVAHLCANGERTAALINVLRMADEERAIVFCRTREEVAERFRQLVTAGFRATYISGERAQTERTRALEALREGRVRLLVATNVAARGLDLPDVGLVVHASLPENPEALTHRSGRTGRAGKKGVNVFVVEAGERRRAERLFAAARLRLRFSPPPSAEAIARHDRERLVDELTAALAEPAAPPMAELAARLLAAHEPQRLVAALVERALAERPAGEPLTSVELTAPPSRSASGNGASVLFQVNLGAKDRAEANWILPLLCRRGAVTRREVGAIRIGRDHTLFEIAAAAAADFAANAAERDPRAPHVRITPAEHALPERSLPPTRRAASRQPAADRGSRPTRPMTTKGPQPTKPLTADGMQPPKPLGARGARPSEAKEPRPPKPMWSNGGRPAEGKGPRPSKPMGASGGRPAGGKGPRPSKPMGTSGAGPAGGKGPRPSKPMAAKGTRPSKPGGKWGRG